MGHVRSLASRRRRVAVAAGALISLFVVTPVSIAAASSNRNSRAAFETDVSNSSGYFAYRSGEPEITVNPTNPNDLAMVYAQTMLTYANHNFTFAGGLPTALFTAPAFIACGLATSTDGGKSWRLAGQPFPTISLNATDCGDPTVVASPDGTLYVGSDVLQPPFSPNPGPTMGIGVVKSTDWGQTWSAPVFTGNPVDRPWLKLDSSTGALYQASGVSGGGRTVTASHDGGTTWSAPQPLGSAALPGGSDGTIDAARGILAAAYVVGTSGDDGAAVGTIAPETGRAASTSGPQVVFETSTTDGQSWNRHLVRLVDGVGTGAFGGPPSVTPDTGQPMAFVSVDPARSGTYAVGVLSSSSTALDVYVTSNSGVTWSRPAVLGRQNPPNQLRLPWIAYSSTGVLGAMWRTIYPNDTQNVFSAVSFAGGNTFTRRSRPTPSRRPPRTHNSDPTTMSHGSPSKTGRHISDGVTGAAAIWPPG